MLESFAAWLGGTPLTAYIENEAWVVPTVQVVHILAIAVVMGSVAIVNLRILGLIERGQSIAALTARFAPPSIAALLVLAATGLLMIAGEPTRAIFRYVFWAKMAMIVLVVVLTAGLLAGLRASGAAADPRAQAPAPFKALAVVGLAIWLAIIVAGRWIGYAQGWPGSPQ
jgi:uncharacterized membrane protein SirB2